MEDISPALTPIGDGPSARSTADRRGAARTRAALFVDFDNIFIGLRQQDPAAAEEFGRNPDGWVSWLQDWVATTHVQDPLASRRSLLLRRCYLNPGAFGRYRPYFVRAGFQVVDCPSLTSAGKNGADIQMVMDVLDALEHRTRFDEFILLSGDSDFTPLLLRLRAYDRRTAILAVGVAAAAYRAACDVMLTEETFIEQALQITGQDDGLMPDRAGVPPRPAATASLPPALRPVAARPTAAPGTVAEREQRRRDGAQVVADLVAQSPLPIPSGTVAQKLLERFGTRLRESEWDGAGSFREFVEGLGDSRFSVSWAIPGYFYDPNRHRLPEAHQVVAQGIDLGDDTLSELAVRIHELTDTPLLTSAQFGAVFRAIAEEVNAHGYFLTQTSRNVRDACRDRGTPVPRQEISFILKGLVYSGSLRGIVPSETEPTKAEGPNDPAALAAAFCQNVIRLCERAQLALTPDEVRLVERWIVGDFLETADPA